MSFVSIADPSTWLQLKRSAIKASGLPLDLAPKHLGENQIHRSNKLETLTILFLLLLLSLSTSFLASFMPVYSNDQ
jgi:hypothetical protein